jgi:hypothetical protein
MLFKFIILCIKESYRPPFFNYIANSAALFFFKISVFIQRERKLLGALSVYDGGAELLVFLPGDPQLVEGAKGGDDGPAQPGAQRALADAH